MHPVIQSELKMVLNVRNKNAAVCREIAQCAWVCADVITGPLLANEFNFLNHESFPVCHRGEGSGIVEADRAGVQRNVGAIVLPYIGTVTLVGQSPLPVQPEGSFRRSGLHMISSNGRDIKAF